MPVKEGAGCPGWIDLTAAIVLPTMVLVMSADRGHSFVSSIADLLIQFVNEARVHRLLEVVLFAVIGVLALTGCDATADEAVGYDLLVSAEIDGPYASIVGLRDGAPPEVVVPHPGEAALRNPQCGPDGTIAYEKNTARQYVPTLWIRSDGDSRSLTNQQGETVVGFFGSGAWAPDGARLLAGVCTQLGYESCARTEVHVFDVESGAGESLGIEGATPIWSPDGERIAYRSGYAIWVARADGSGSRRVTRQATPSTAPVEFTWGPGADDVTVRWLLEGPGYRYEIVDVDTGEQRPLPMTSDARFFWFDWDSSGSRLTYLASRGAGTPQSAAYLMRYRSETEDEETLLSTAPGYPTVFDLNPSYIEKAQWCPR